MRMPRVIYRYRQGVKSTQRWPTCLDGVAKLRLNLLGEFLGHGGVQPVGVSLLELVGDGGALLMVGGLVR